MRYFLLHQLGHPPGRYTISYSQAEMIWSLVGKDIITIDDGYLAIYDFLSRRRKVLPRVILFIVAGKVGRMNDWDSSGELAGQKLMDWDQIKELHQSGVEIGSHGLYHLDLRGKCPEEMLREVGDSKLLLEDKLGIPVEGFAYPFGYYDRHAIEVVREVGYKWAMTTSDSIWRGSGDPYRRRRIEIRGTDSDFVIRWKISSWYDLKAAWELPRLVYEKMRCSRFGR